MSNEESLEARQENEFEALEAIYGADVKDLRGKAVWNRWTPLNVSLSLTPQQGSSGTQEIYVKIDLHIICSEKYPNSIPKIMLENSKGLSNTVLVELQEKLERKANELKGEEMIFQLAQYRQKEKEEKDLQAKQIEQDRQRKYMIEEVQRRQEMLKSEVRLRRENRHNSENEEEFEANRRFSFVSRRRNNSSTESSEESLCQHKSTTLVEFGHREIQRGRCIKHSAQNRVSFGGIDNDTGELVIVTEWIIENKDKNELPYVQRQLSSIEQELNYLTKLKHSNLRLKSQPVLEASSDEDSSGDDEAWGAVYREDSDSDGIEFEHDSESESLSKDEVSVSSVKNVDSTDSPQEIVKQIDFMEIVEGLVHIHQQGMIHRDLKPVNEFLDSDDHVKIGDFGLATTSIKSRQNEYVLSRSAVESEKEDTVDESKTGLVGTALYVAPEISTSLKVVYNQKVDIYSL
ncbi:hypothetical protein NQ318_006226, partial [Aromia moschata]